MKGTREKIRRKEGRGIRAISRVDIDGLPCVMVTENTTRGDIEG